MKAKNQIESIVHKREKYVNIFFPWITEHMGRCHVICCSVGITVSPKPPEVIGPCSY